MNLAELNGRLTKDVEVRYSQDQKAFGRFTLAVKRRGRDAGADFINCVAFGKDAEVIEKYTKKGDLLTVWGSIHIGSYTNRDGQKVNTTDIYVNGFDLHASSKKEEKPEDDGFIPAQPDPELPF